MNLPWFVEERLNSWYKNDIHEIEDDFVVQTRDTFYCCNCTRHLDMKFKAKIIGRRQHRCIDCQKKIMNTCK
jgi:hypothetical protein